MVNATSPKSVRDFLYHCDFVVEENHAERDCFFVATHGPTSCSPQKMRKIAAAHAHHVQQLTLEVCERLARPGEPTDNAQIVATLAAFDNAFPSGILELHSPTEKGVWFCVNREPVLVTMSLALALVEVGDGLVVILHTGPEGDQQAKSVSVEVPLGHFELCRGATHVSLRIAKGPSARSVTGLAAVSTGVPTCGGMHAAVVAEEVSASGQATLQGTPAKTRASGAARVQDTRTCASRCHAVFPTEGQRNAPTVVDPPPVWVAQRWPITNPHGHPKPGGHARGYRHVHKERS